MALGSGPRRILQPSRRGMRNDDPKAFAATVGESVRRARQSVGWTQAELAEAAGFSPNYIARLERGELGPSFFVAHQLCEALGMDVDSLLHGGVPNMRTTRRRIA